MFFQLLRDSHRLEFVLEKDWDQEGSSNIAHWTVVSVLYATITGSINSAHNVLKYLNVAGMLLRG